MVLLAIIVFGSNFFILLYNFLSTFILDSSRSRFVANVLRIQLERQNGKHFPSLREYSLYYGINKKLLDDIGKDIIIMHPGPINRGVEVSSDVADSDNSIILDQVENGVAIRMAVMYLLSLNRN